MVVKMELHKYVAGHIGDILPVEITPPNPKTTFSLYTGSYEVNHDLARFYITVSQPDIDPLVSMYGKLIGFGQEGLVSSAPAAPEIYCTLPRGGRIVLSNLDSPTIVHGKTQKEPIRIKGKGSLVIWDEVEKREEVER